MDVIIFIIAVISLTIIIYLDRKTYRTIARLNADYINCKKLLEDISRVDNGSSIIINSRNSSIKISDLKEIFSIICPIQIFIDGKLEWDDNQDTKDWSDVEFEAFKEKYRQIKESDRAIKKFSFYTTEFHHSVVVIETED